MAQNVPVGYFPLEKKNVPAAFTLYAVCWCSLHLDLS